MVSTLRTSASVSRRAMRPLRCGYESTLFQAQELGAALLVQRKLLFARQPSNGHQHHVARRLHLLFQRAQALRPLGFEYPPDVSCGFANLLQKVHGFLTCPSLAKRPPQDDSIVQRRIAMRSE